MKKIIVLLLTALSYFTTQATNIGGIVSTNTTLDSTGNPYMVTSNLQIPSGVTLTINPGVKLYMSTDVKIIVEGTIRAIGTSSQRILFTKGGTVWRGIELLNAAIDYDSATGNGCRFEYCDFEYTQLNSGTYYYLLDAHLSAVLVNQCNISNVGAAIYCGNGSIISDNKITKTNNYGSHIAIICEPVAKVIIRGNEISGYADIGLKLGSNSIFEGNYVHDMSSGEHMRIFGNATIINNRFENNPNSLVIRINGVAAGAKIYNNKFENNKYSILIECQPTLNIEYNCFVSAVKRHIYCTSTTDFNLHSISPNCTPSGIYNMSFENNFWGFVPDSILDTLIYDGNDDITSKTKVDYLPRLDSCRTRPNLPSGISKVNENVFQIYPNPATSEVHVKMAESGATGTLTLTDIMGRTIARYSLERQKEISITVSHLIKGFYFINLSNGIQTTTKKLLIN